MDKNKSIDGLKPRRSRKAAPSSAKPSAKVTAKASTPKSTKSKPRSTTSSKPRTVKSKPSRTTSIPVQSDLDTVQDLTPTDQAATPTIPSTNTTPSHTSVAEDFLSPTQVFDFDGTSGELKAAKPGDATKPSKKPKKHKKHMSKKRRIIISIIIIILLLAAGVAGFLIWSNLRLANMGIDGNIFDLISETYEPLKTDANGRTNILVFGTSGYDMEGTEGNGVHDGAQLTDSIMIISLDQNTGDVAMLSLPRDLKASPTCTATGKINEVYWCNNMEGNNEQAGVDALIAEVSDILDIDIQYYAHVNWGSLVQVVDALGGITVTVDEDIDDYYRYEAGGTYTMGGEEALWLARIRHGTAHGDFTRSASQQKILIGIKDKILASQLGIPELLNLFDTLSNNLKVNFSSTELKTLAHLLTDLDISNARQVSLIEPTPLVTTGTINGISYVLPSAGAGNYLAIQKYIAKMFSSDPRDYEDYTILVLNATDTPGLASTEEITLTDEGYDNITIDDAPTGEYSDGYTLYALTDTAPGTKKLLEDKYGASQSIDALPATISQDYDFVLIVNTATTSQD